MELLKGLGFVTVTSTLLYLLLRAWREPLAPTLDREPVPTNRHNLLVFVTLLALVPAAGFGVLALSAPAAERQALSDLELANALRARQIESWLHARQHDATDLAADPALSAATRRRKRRLWRGTGRSGGSAVRVRLRCRYAASPDYS